MLTAIYLNKEHAIPFDIEWPLLKLRQAIEKQLLIPIKAQKIIFAGQILKQVDDAKRVVDLNLQKESKFYVLYVQE